MDEDLEELLRSANRKIMIQNKKELLRSKFLMDTTFAHGGGTFVITREFLALVATLVNSNRVEILLDQHGRPIMIYDVPLFYKDIQTRYHEALNSYYHEYEKLRKSRGTASLIQP